MLRWITKLSRSLWDSQECLPPKSCVMFFSTTVPSSGWRETSAEKERKRRGARVRQRGEIENDLMKLWARTCFCRVNRPMGNQECGHVGVCLYSVLRLNERLFPETRIGQKYSSRGSLFLFTIIIIFNSLLILTAVWVV